MCECSIDFSIKCAKVEFFVEIGEMIGSNGTNHGEQYAML